MTDELAAIEAAHGNCTDGCVVPTLLAALHAEQEARARVEALIVEWSGARHAYVDAPMDDDAEEQAVLHEVEERMHAAALAPDASEGEPNL
jgi:hypothetical protein